MKNRLLTTIKNTYFILFCLFFASCQTNNKSNPPDTTKDTEAIKAVLKGIEANWNSGNFYTYYADDVVTMPPGRSANVGKTAVMKNYDELFANTTSNLTIDAVDEVRVSGDLGVARISYTEILTPKSGGDKRTDKGKELMVFQRQADGSWKMVTDIWNFNN